MRRISLRARLIHKFKKGAPLARIVRRAEATLLSMTDAEARTRHAATCADGAYIGPYGNNFTQEWCKLVYGGSCVRLFGQRSADAPAPSTDEPAPSADRPAPSADEPAPSAAAPAVQSSADALASQPQRSADRPAPWADEPAPSADEPAPSAAAPAVQSALAADLVLDASCEFHLAQSVGRFVDRKFPAVARFEKLLRDLKDEFGDGPSRVYLRASARLLGKKVKALLAPKVDNFKVTLYSRGFHTRFLYNYDVLYKSLAAKLSATYQNELILAWGDYKKAVQAWERGEEERRKKGKKRKRKKKPAPPSQGRGLRVKKVQDLRSMGLRLTDPFLVVFSLGRGDLRDKFLSAYATMTQNYKLSGLVKNRCRDEMCSAMRAGIHQLMLMAGSLRCLHYAANVRKPGSSSFDLGPKRQHVGVKSLRLHIKVIGAHFGWHFIPNVVRILPDLLIPLHSDRKILGMSVKPGIKPGTSPFLDPLPKKVAQRDAYRSRLRSYETPGYWWSRVIDALDQLVRFLRMELIYFQDRLQSWDLHFEDAGAGL